MSDDTEAREQTRDEVLASRALAQARVNRDVHHANHDQLSFEIATALAAIRLTHDEARSQALEECAKIADELKKDWPTAASIIATNIRALHDKGD